mgnify:CR=1 FL=1
MEATVLLDKTEAVATITLNRPGSFNALDMPTARCLLEATIDCSADADIRAVLVTGAGRAFCAGGDVKAMGRSLEQDPSVFLKQLTVYLHATVAEIARMPKPVIGVVNGIAAGAGFSLALACDLLVASTEARFVLAYTRIGLSPDGSATHTLPRLLGWRNALELMLTNRTIDAAEALRLGVVSSVYLEAELHKRARELALQLAQGPVCAIAETKRLVRQGRCDLESQMEEERQAIARTAATDDFRKNVRAFVENR